MASGQVTSSDHNDSRNQTAFRLRAASGSDLRIAHREVVGAAYPLRTQQAPEESRIAHLAQRPPERFGEGLSLGGNGEASGADLQRR